MRALVLACVLVSAEGAFSLGKIGSNLVASLKSITGLGAPAVALANQHTCSWAEHESGACASTASFEVEVLVNGADGGSGTVVTVDLAKKSVYDAFSTFDGMGAYFAGVLGGEEKLLLQHQRGGVFGYGAPWRIYDASGVRVLRAADLARVGGTPPSAFGAGPTRVYVVPNNMQWVWPSNRVGSVVTVPDVTTATGESVTLTTVNVSPRVFEIGGFLTDAEVDEIIAEASAISDSSSGMMRSMTGNEGEVSSMRTSDNAWLKMQPVNVAVKARAFELLRMHTRASTPTSTSSFDEDLADGIQVLRYNVTNGYREHHDYFPIGSEGVDGYNYDATRGGANRFATVFLYLSDVELGGQTAFPSAKLPEPTAESSAALALAEELFSSKHHWEEDAVRKCFSSVATTPKKASAILFYSQTPLGELDPMSLHTGCPVLKGKKWAANLWVWNGIRVVKNLDRAARAGVTAKIHVTFVNKLGKQVHAYWVAMKSDGSYDESRTSLVHQGYVCGGGGGM